MRKFLVGLLEFVFGLICLAIIALPPVLLLVDIFGKHHWIHSVWVRSLDILLDTFIIVGWTVMAGGAGLIAGAIAGFLIYILVAFFACIFAAIAVWMGIAFIASALIVNFIAIIATAIRLLSMLRDYQFDIVSLPDTEGSDGPTLSLFLFGLTIGILCSSGVLNACGFINDEMCVDSDDA